ncbi:MAG: hypothetical protein FJ280_27165, partial [Planctomycetes bacterium]|nr:hypothetical protein [Planctomycetota bacterium]
MVRRIDMSWRAGLLLAAVLATVGAGTTGTPESEALPGVKLVLPAAAKIKVGWVCPPLDEQQVLDAPWRDLRFAVDASGQPWLAVPGQNLVLNPVGRYRFSLSHRFSDFACLDNGALLFQTDRDLGFVGLTDKPVVQEGQAVLPFQPAVSLPLSGCRLYAGAGDCLYVAGAGPEGNYEVHLLQPESTSGGAKRTLRRFRKIFECPEPIRAVTGDGTLTFVSFGRVIARIGRPGRTKPELIVHPTDDVTDLAWLPDAGLFYATETAVGVATDEGPWDFLGCCGHQIDLRGGTLYVLFTHTLGVLALDNIADVARHRPPATPAGRTQEPPAKVTDLRFYAPEDDRNGKHIYATTFDGAKVRMVSASFRIQPTRRVEQKIRMTIERSYFQKSHRSE